jgi:asparagine synthase (glutamine-hydrolysing)
MFAIPREQSIRPTQRRSLMRRALTGIVPDDILNKKRKATIARAPLLGISREWATLVVYSRHMVADSIGIIDSERFLAALQNAKHGEELHWIPLTRAVHIEVWFRSLLKLGVVDFKTATGSISTFEAPACRYQSY